MQGEGRLRVGNGEGVVKNCGGLEVLRIYLTWPKFEGNPGNGGAVEWGGKFARAVGAIGNIAGLVTDGVGKVLKVLSVEGNLRPEGKITGPGPSSREKGIW